MTEEQKDKLEQAADAMFYRNDHTFAPCDYARRAGFVRGAQTILDNPGEWGLTSDPYKDLMWVEITDDLKAQLSRFRSTLLEVHELLRMADPHCRDSALEEMKDIIEVALEQ